MQRREESFAAVFYIRRVVFCLVGNVFSSSFPGCIAARELGWGESLIRQKAAFFIVIIAMSLPCH